MGANNGKRNEKDFLMVTRPSIERQDAQATYPAELQTVGNHARLDVAVSGDFIERPALATHIQMQALTQNIRYTIDNSEATATHGFQLAVGGISLVPVPNNGISVFEEVSGAIVQYQFVR